ncbi:MAG: ROK family transcriptional regulator [Gemmatimonadaceae bacterium]|jgi:glucokinase-like ROK family protein|nr:ROK family transcriptional regulator [Gemmatimonadaceae bacterium]
MRDRLLYRAPAQSVGRATVPSGARPSALADTLLRLIWQEREISRAELARRTELSRSTVSELVASLIERELVAEAGVGESSGGRRPINLHFRDDACRIVGLDIGATHLTVVITDLRGRVLTTASHPCDVRHDPDGTRTLAAALIERSLQERSAGRAPLLGIGIGLPCPVDPRHPERLSPLVLPAWEGRHGFDALQRAFNAPLFLDNDANLGALAEQWWGAGRGVRDFTYIKVATGIGSGHVIDGAVRRGATGVAGEIGHVAIDPRGELCGCGNRGCLQTFVGAAALVRRAESLLADFPSSALHASKRKRALTIAAIEAAAIDDDPLAVQVVSEAAGHLGIAIAGLLNLQNPAAVIIGGGLARVGHRLLEPLRETVLRRTFVSAVAASEIKHSELGPLGVAVGAATLALEAALADPSLFPSVGAA